MRSGFSLAAAVTAPFGSSSVVTSNPAFVRVKVRSCSMSLSSSTQSSLLIRYFQVLDIVLELHQARGDTRGVAGPGQGFHLFSKLGEAVKAIAAAGAGGLMPGVP